jgi:hypothetical protein
MFTRTPRGRRCSNGEPERGTAHAADDDIEVAAETLHDSRGAQPAQQRPGSGGVADQRGDISAAGPGQLDRHPADPAGRPGDQHAPAEQQPPDLQGPQRRQPGRGEGGRLQVRNADRHRRHPVDRNRRQLRPCPRLTSPTTRVLAGGPPLSPAARSTTPATSRPAADPGGSVGRSLTSPRFSDDARTRTSA